MVRKGRKGREEEPKAGRISRSRTTCVRPTLVHAGYVNFYADDAVNPYVALAARGPWVVTLKGAVLHDSGGYGMLGFGHTPCRPVIEAMARPQVMANIMTPSLSQLRFAHGAAREIGHRRGGCPYDKFLCLNSGSESVSLAGRIADVNTKLMTDRGRAACRRKVKRIAVKGAFHGRTELPALYSDSSRKTYLQHLASYRTTNAADHHRALRRRALRQAFAEAEPRLVHRGDVPGAGDGRRRPGPRGAAGVLRRRARADQGARHPAAGRLDPGRPARPRRAVDRRLPGLRRAPGAGHGDLLQGAQRRPVPAERAGGERARRGLYRKGIYGNTMTTNPRAMDVACAVLDMLTPALRENIRERGREFLDKLEKLKANWAA
jgi:4-aminobutyrate aminotransferase-like enzyme